MGRCNKNDSTCCKLEYSETTVNLETEQRTSIGTTGSKRR